MSISLSRDSLNRRRRDRPQSSDKRVTPQPRDLLWFQKIQEHGPLSSRYLHAFSAYLARSEKRSRDRLTDLFNESRTPHNGAYLTRPWQQFETLDARYRELVYDLAPPAEAALREHGLWHDFGASAGGPWRHRYMVAAITASIELATFGDPDLTFIPQHAILARAGATLRHSVPLSSPASDKEARSDLIPDALFGLEYRHGGTKSYRFFLVEADRGTEPTRASKFNRKSHLRNFLQYRDYVGGGLYRAHLGLTASLLVLNVTASATTLASMLKLSQEVSPGGNSYQLFQCAPEFGRYFRPAPPSLDWLHAPWLRAGMPPLRIDRP